MSQEKSETSYHIREVRASITYVCNLKCKHCYALDDVPNQHGREDIYGVPNGALPVLLTRLRRTQATERLSLSGGEPLVPGSQTRTLNLTKFSRDLGMKVRICTNGTFLDEPLVERIAEAAGEPRQMTLQISVDSADPAVHDAFRDTPGALTKTLRGIQHAHARGIVVHARYSIRNNESDDAVHAYELMNDLGADAFIAKAVFYSGRARYERGMAAEYESIRQTQRQLAAASHHRGTILKLAQPVFITAADLPEGANAQILECNCGKEGVTINQEGDVYPCNLVYGAVNGHELKLGNLSDPTFDLIKIWNLPATYPMYRISGRKTCPSFEIIESSRRGNCIEQGLDG